MNVQPAGAFFSRTNNEAKRLPGAISTQWTEMQFTLEGAALRTREWGGEESRARGKKITRTYITTPLHLGWTSNPIIKI